MNSSDAMFESDISGLELLARGKVRDIYSVDDDHLLVGLAGGQRGGGEKREDSVHAGWRVSEASLAVRPQSCHPERRAKPVVEGSQDG